MNMNIVYLAVILLAAIAIFWLGEVERPLRTATILIGIMLLTYSSNFSALAAPQLGALGARDEALTQAEQAEEEQLKITPGGGHYSGIEYAERTASEELPVSDRTIEQSIEKYTSDNVVVTVNNGAVRLSGRVQNQEIAQHIVEQIKEIPGVHEITFNLGLNERA